MPNTSPSSPDARYSLAALLEPASLAKLGAIGAIVLALIVLFLWTGGWLTSGRLTQTRLIDTFEDVNGPHPGFRRNHAKGVCLAGTFESNGDGTQFSTASAFKPGRVPVSGRFALAGGMPMRPDKPTAVRSMALSFALADGETWRTAMNDIPVFPVRDPQAFYGQLLSSRRDPRTGKPDPIAKKAFLAAHPETARAMATIRAHPFSSGFANATYNALNAFLLVDAAGRTTPVRWSMRPVDAFAPEPSNPPADKNYLFDELIARIAKAPAQWHLILTIGQPGDPTNDATLPWPTDRQQVNAGTLSVDRIVAEAESNCRDISFDPLTLPAGIEPSDDPLLSARSAAYSVSFSRRAGEPKTPSAVQVPQGR
ncbi:catalase family peroxidase [Enhydrobacter sp.]|jgi:catalase|uniref:catalase family peroxidase n=1 Tax=Enhydrobacter sp. TaxID=1894999 RepID=UPI002606F181|nr:catalase family peroxidase [Enhydrobacter sp.]WIM10368.1 MAG: Catalase-like heme-binding protein [Enhydrobacter sp.]